jgi:hypothetical protein
MQTMFWTNFSTTSQPEIEEHCTDAPLSPTISLLRVAFKGPS